MNSYITGTTIKQLREERGFTQATLADMIGVSSKTVSKWETGKGLPDISLIQPLSKALGVSVIELMNGEQISNTNRSGNLMRLKLYICPICGNVLHSTGDALISCCGVTLPALEAEDPDDEHGIAVECVEDEHFLTVDHPMTKDHFISFAAFAAADRLQLIKFYPEGNAQCRFQKRGHGILYICCNRHGLYKKRF